MCTFDVCSSSSAQHAARCNYVNDATMPQVCANSSISCQCDGCRTWKEFVGGTLPGGPQWPQYEVFTSDYVTGLAEYVWYGMVAAKGSAVAAFAVV